ncbi:MAG: amidohydrolase family protein [Gammaproteobacteria bacterium]|nr:MAG: amidohydrolase family protein [Gammaproteobacteria bacterium]
MASRCFTNLRVWDGVAAEYLDGMSLRIDGSQIGFVGPGGAQGAAVELRDASGLTVIPGLIDAHVHMCLDPEIRDPMKQTSGSRTYELEAMRSRAVAMARAGITTARDLGGGKWYEFQIRDEITAGACEGPRLVCAGQPVTSPGGHCHFWGGEAEDAESAFEVIDRQVRRGSDLIKVMATGGTLTPGSTPKDAQFDRETLTSIVGEANRQGRHVAAHCHGTTGIANACDAGVRTIEHCSWVGEDGWGRNYDDAIARRIGERGVFVSPTINSGWRRRIGSSGEYEDRVRDNFRRLRAAGVQLIASTDAGIPGVFHDRLADALPVFAHFAGLSPRETLMSATSIGALGIGLDTLTGRIAAGLAADLLFVEGDPLNDLEVLLKPVAVLTAGRAVSGLPHTELVR